MFTSSPSLLIRLTPAGLLLLAACGGGGGGGGSGPTTAPSNLDYPVEVVLLSVLVDSPSNTPTVDGAVEDWSISPALPAGLALDPDSGAIGGKPTETSDSTVYTITAANSLGSTTADISLAVTGTANFLYVANRDDNTISVYSLDSHSGLPAFQGYAHAAAGETAPERLVFNEQQQVLYAVNSGDGVTVSNVSLYDCDEGDRSLTALAPEAVAPELTDMVIDPTGEFAYVASFDEDLIYPFLVSQVDGSLTPSGAPVPCGNGPVDLVISPAGDFLWAVNRKGNSVSTYAIEPTMGELTESTPELVLSGRPTRMVVNAGGSHAFLIYEQTNRVVSFEIDESTGELQQSADRATPDTPSALSLHPTGEFLYVASRGTARVQTFLVDVSTGELSSTATVDVNAGAEEIAFDPAGLYAFVLDSGVNELLAYEVHQGTGKLTLIGRVRTRANPSALALVPGGTPLVEFARGVYVVNNNTDDLTAYSIAADGGLTEEGTPAAAGNDPRAVAIDPKQRFLALADGGSNNLVLYDIDDTSGEVASAWAPVVLAGKARGVAIDPTGSWLFVPERETATVKSFAIDADNRQLTLVNTVNVGTNPYALGIDPTGRFLYVSDATDDFIYALTVEDGVLSGPFMSVEAPGNPQRVRFTPAGDFLIAPLQTGDHLATFSIDPITGALTTVLPGREAHEGPMAAEVHRSGRFLFAALRGNPLQVGQLASYSFNPTTARITNEHVNTDNVRPRDLALDPNGVFLFTADEEGNTVSSFAIDPDSGTLSLIESAATGLKPMALAVTKGFTVEALP